MRNWYGGELRESASAAGTATLEMKKWVILVVLLAAGYGGYTIWKKEQKNNSASQTENRQSTAIAELRDISFAVNAAGEIGPAEQVSVRPEINGKIDVLPVDIGDHVKKGDLLFKLDDKELQQEKATTVTDIEKAQLNLQKAERDYKRAKQLLDEKLISQELFDDTKTAFDLAKNALERSQRDLALVEEHLTKTTVQAPFDCTVLTRPVSIGQAVSGSGGFNSGTEVLTIADLHSLVILAQVNQADVPRLKVNETVEVTIEAVAGLKINGMVERISPQATIKNNIKGFAARIVLKNDDARVRPGMTANVKIPVASAENVTAVPLAAVFTEKNPDSEEMERFVYVQQGENFEKKNVKVGVSDYFYAEIQEGISEGDVVALELPKEELEKKTQQAGHHKGGKKNGDAAKNGSVAQKPGTSADSTNVAANVSNSSASASSTTSGTGGGGDSKATSPTIR
jgi:HlyD family secretion protein